MNNSTVNFTTTETSTDSIWLILRVEICVYSFSVLFGLPTHSYVIWLIVTGTGSGIASEFFILDLSVCEIINCVNCLFFSLSVWFSSILMIAISISGLVIAGRPLFQCLICVERYLAVVHPVTFLKFKPLRYRVMCSAVVWIITLSSCLCCSFIAGLRSIEGHSWFFSVQFLLFFSIQLFCCVSVLRALKQSGPGERGREREEENHMKRRAFYIILITAVSMFIMYVPIIITGALTVLTQEIIPAVWFPSVMFYALSGFVQPALYLYRAGKLSCLCSKI